MTEVYLELGKTKIVACSLAWPGWEIRSGCSSACDARSALTSPGYLPAPSLWIGIQSG